MSESIVRLEAADYKDAVAFLNFVFSEHYPIDFPTTLPKLYKPTDELMSMNFAVKRDSKIRAIVGLYPLELHIGQVVLKLGAIGAVSTHPNDRGLGYMQRLMTHCVQVMKSASYDLSWLGGQRQRYGFFGYEVCGSKLLFMLTKKNIQRCYNNVPEFQFEKIIRADDKRIETMKVWHETLLIHCSRPLGRFYDVLQSWEHDLFAVLDKAGVLVGYLSADVHRGIIFEAAARENSLLMDMIPAWVAFQEQDKVVFETAPLPSFLVSELMRICESSTVQPCGNWQIYNWQRVVETTLQIKHQFMTLPDGSFCLDIQGYGRIELHVSGDAAFCRHSIKEPDFSCDPQTAMRLLFGPFPAVMSGQINNPVLNGWCPLPLYLPKQDEV